MSRTLRAFFAAAFLLDIFSLSLVAQNGNADPSTFTPDGGKEKPTEHVVFKAGEVKQKPAAYYFWKKGVVATVFWIGEGSKAASAWNPNWEQDYGGPDLPENRKGYSPDGHAPLLNPFYVALPFDDVAHPDQAAKWLPASWPAKRENKSACQHRWVELRNERGNICYAQWEDAGPLRNDRAEYVFGPEAAGKEPGVEVSPAVADYLNLTGESQCIVSWRLVDDTDVRPGMWLKYNEMAMIYRAMHHAKTGETPAAH